MFDPKKDFKIMTIRLKRRWTRESRGRNVWWNSRGGTCGGVRGVFFWEVGGEGGIGESGVLPSHSGVGLMFLNLNY